MLTLEQRMEILEILEDCNKETALNIALDVISDMDDVILDLMDENEKACTVVGMLLEKIEDLEKDVEDLEILLDCMSEDY